MKAQTGTRQTRTGVASARAVTPAVTPEPAAREPRAPRHERGHRRVDAILDAASAILIEGGMAALTVDAIAKRSQTSKSSMYHFFPDRERVLHALAERHIARIHEGSLLRVQEESDWARLTLERMVDRYLEPFRTYVDEHPDLLEIMAAGFRSGSDAARATGLEALHLARAERVVAARLPDAKPAERRARGLALLAVALGVIEFSARMSPAQRATLWRELKHVLVAYLGAAEADGPRR